LHISGKLAVVGIVLFIGGLIATFILVYVVGDPIAMYINEMTPPSAIPGIIAHHGLDQPLHLQFFYYLRDLFSGNWVGPPEAMAIGWWTITVIYLGGLLLSIISLVYYLLKVRKTG
jgi:ABC-type dipeptide/oligopeptide/nickel transport system permease component